MEDKYKNPENLQTALDCAIRDKEKKEAGYIEGYKVKKSGICYKNYMSNETWKEYINKMPNIHKDNFISGNGGELNEGKYPPKMASFGSSSRFIYELSKEIKGFSFEEKLDTRVGGIANIDGFIYKDNKDKKYIYIEAKRREIYGSHNKEIKSVYTKVYDKIKNVVGQDFSYESKKSDKEGYNIISFKIKGEDASYFDLKQLICHFLGITYDLIKHDIREPNIVFLYLLYNPEDIKDELENYKKYSEKISERYKKVKNFIDDHIEQFKKIFDAVLDYQVETNNKEKPKIEFEFKLVDQNNYKEMIYKQIE